MAPARWRHRCRLGANRQLLTTSPARRQPQDRYRHHRRRTGEHHRTEQVSGEPKREPRGPYLSSADRFTARADLDISSLLGAPRAVGIDLAQQLLRQLGVGVPVKILDQWQDEILGPHSEPEPLPDHTSGWSPIERGSEHVDRCSVKSKVL